MNDRVVTLAEVLRDGGYHTYMSGKWHLGEEPEHFPAARGFETSFSLLSGDVAEIYTADEPVGGEMAGGKWLRRGDYKAVMVPLPYGQGEWQLFNLAKDPGETEDLSKKYPEKIKELKAAWKQYAEDVGVVETSGAISR